MSYDYDIIRGKPAKEVIFTEKNIRNWVIYAMQIPYSRLISDIEFQTKLLCDIKLEKGEENHCTRQEARMETVYFRYHSSEEWYYRFVECCFVEAFDLSLILSEEWISPSDIMNAYEKYPDIFLARRAFFGFYEVRGKPREVCESYYRVGSLEKHPDDKEETDETRYRINVDYVNT